MDVEELDPSAHSLERDLCASEFIVEKVKGDATYAQHLYAAMCNNDFTKNDVWPILQQETWSCSWRYAGGIVAEIRGEGSYMDWYCSGMTGSQHGAATIVANLTESQHEDYLTRMSVVPESHVTDEIRRDLLKIGWLVVTEVTDYSKY